MNHASCKKCMSSCFMSKCCKLHYLSIHSCLPTEDLGVLEASSPMAVRHPALSFAFVHQTHGRPAITRCWDFGGLAARAGMLKGSFVCQRPLLLQVRDLMRVLKRPFDEQPGAEKYRVAAPKEIRMGVELLSCSS